MNKKERILEKVSKLLAAQGDGAVNAKEIAVANKLMKKLMDKYDISINQIQNIKLKKVGVIEKEINLGFPRDWPIFLVSVLTEFYDCKALSMGRGSVIKFIGYDIDVLVCMQMFNYLYENISVESGLLSKSENQAHFCMGVVFTLGKRFKEMKIVPEMSKDLVVLKEDEIDKHIAEEHPFLESRQMKNPGYSGAMMKGEAYGKTISLNEQIR